MYQKLQVENMTTLVLTPMTFEIILTTKKVMN